MCLNMKPAMKIKMCGMMKLNIGKLIHLNLNLSPALMHYYDIRISATLITYYTLQANYIPILYRLYSIHIIYMR